MSETITWRSVAAPNFGSSAALMNAGSDSMNQGIASLAGLAKGVADEQKGIAVSNAVAALGKATNDTERGSIFDANAANLSASGIDLKDFIAANQAQHKTLQGDEAFKTNQELAASNLLANESKLKTAGLEQLGLGIKNQSEQKMFDHLATVQQQQDAAAALAIRVGDSNIATNASNAASHALSAAASAEHSRALTGQIGKENSKTDLLRNAASKYATLLNDPSVLDTDPVTKTPVINQSKVYDLALKSGMNPIDIASGKQVYEGIIERGKGEANLAKIAANTREDSQIAAEQANKIAVAKENHKDKPLSEKDFNDRASEVADSLTGVGSPFQRSTLEGHIKTLASSVGQAKAFSIVGDSLGSDGLIDFVKLNTNIGKASLQKAASKDSVSNPDW
jgi:hypothetical protein